MKCDNNVVIVIGNGDSREALHGIKHIGRYSSLNTNNITRLAYSSLLAVE